MRGEMDYSFVMNYSIANPKHHLASHNSKHFLYLQHSVQTATLVSWGLCSVANYREMLLRSRTNAVTKHRNSSRVKAEWNFSHVPSGAELLVLSTEITTLREGFRYQLDDAQFNLKIKQTPIEIIHQKQENFPVSAFVFLVCLSCTWKLMIFRLLKYKIEFTENFHIKKVLESQSLCKVWEVSHKVLEAFV